MEEAVKTAKSLAEKGDTVLLSPCCASFDLFNNYEHRGQLFKEEVLKIIKKEPRSGDKNKIGFQSYEIKMEQQENKFELLKGDKVLWMVIILISFFSVFPVYSASSNLEYIVQNGTTTGHYQAHVFVFLGLAIMRAVGTVKYEHIGKLAVSFWNYGDFTFL